MKNNLTLNRQAIGGFFCHEDWNILENRGEKLGNESLYFFGKTWYNSFRKLRVPINWVLTKSYKIGKKFPGGSQLP